MTDTTTPKKRTITLTGRPPVSIHEDDWPILAEASYHDWDNQYEFQANQHWRGSLIVRHHNDDGRNRAIVYAVCSYTTQYQGDRGYVQKAGELLPADATMEQIVAAIRRVHASIDIVDVDHRDMWRLLADECIADLPAEEL